MSGTSRGLPAAEALAIAEALAQASRRILYGPRGVVVHGSLTLGDYLPGRSDIDLLVVVDQPVNQRWLGALASGAERVWAGAPVPVDLRVVTSAMARAPSPTPTMEGHIRLNRRHEPAARIEGCCRGERDLVVELAACRAHGHSLIGPVPAKLIGAVRDEWVLEAGDAQLAEWQAIGEDPAYAELTVLTACRVWRFAEELRHCSKRAAGEWALRRDPSLDVVREALERRHRKPERRINAAQVQALLAFVRDRVAKVRGLHPLTARATA